MFLNSIDRIVISPDGNTIAYIGSYPSPFIFFYSKIGDDYYYNNMQMTDHYSEASNSLQFTNNSNLYCISLYDTPNIHLHKYEPSYILNPGFLAYP